MKAATRFLKINEHVMTCSEMTLNAESSLRSEPLTGNSDLAESIRVWLVDDDKEIRSLMAVLLSSEGGFDCARQFSSAGDLLDALASEVPPEVILLDIQIGEENGLAAIRPIKLLAPSTHVLMVTTCSDSLCKQQARSNGASDFLLKSYSIKEIAHRIRLAMKQQPTPAFACETADSTSPDAEAAETTFEFSPTRSANSKPVVVTGRFDWASGTRPIRGRWRVTWWGHVVDHLLRCWHAIESNTGIRKGETSARLLFNQLNASEVESGRLRQPEGLGSNNGVFPKREF